MLQPLWRRFLEALLNCSATPTRYTHPLPCAPPVTHAAACHWCATTSSALQGTTTVQCAQAHGLVLMAHALVHAAVPPFMPSEAHHTLTCAQVEQLPALLEAVRGRLLWMLPGGAPAAVKRDATLLLATLCMLPLAEPCEALQELKRNVLQTCQATLQRYHVFLVLICFFVQHLDHDPL